MGQDNSSNKNIGLQNLKKIQDTLTLAAEAAQKINLPIHSAKSLHDRDLGLQTILKYEREKALRAREVEDSIISSSEKQDITNTYLEHNQKLNMEQVKLMSMLVEAQNALQQEQVKSAEEARHSAKVQFWMNMFLIFISVVGLGLAIADFYTK